MDSRTEILGVVAGRFTGTGLAYFAAGPEGSGDIRAGDFLAAWLAHDYLNIRQINELRFAWNVEQSKPFDVAYAGDW